MNKQKNIDDSFIWNWNYTIYLAFDMDTGAMALKGFIK